MGIFSASSKPVNLTQTTKEEFSPQQAELFSSFFPKVKSYAETPLQMFSGSGIAGFSPDEIAAQNMYRTAAGPGGSVSTLANQAGATQAQLMDPNFMLGDNPHLQAMRAAISGSVGDDLLQRVLPSVRSGNVAAGGMYSGGASKAGLAEGQAVGQAGTGLARQLQELMFNAYNRGVTGLGEAVNRNPSVMAQQMLPADMLAAVGGQQRGMEQAQLDEQIRNFYTQQQLPFLQAQELMSFLQGMPGQTTSKVTGTVPGPSLCDKLLGAGAAAAGTAAKFA
jgi:hypothetical protein